MRNPIPTLARHTGLTPRTLGLLLHRHQSEIHHLFTAKELNRQDYEQLRDHTLTHWGASKNSVTRKLLWKCYYPDDRPNIFQVLHYRMAIPIVKLRMRGMSEKTVKMNLVRSRIPVRQLRGIASYALALKEELSSTKSLGGVDTRYQEIYRAVTDPTRIRRQVPKD